MKDDIRSIPGRCKSCGTHLWIPQATPKTGYCGIHGCSMQGEAQEIEDGRLRHSVVLDVVTRRLKAAFEVD